jgi:predicted dehydrogenase
MNRRKFLVTSGAGAVGLATALASAGKAVPEAGKKIRVGFIGVGHRGSYLLKVGLGVPGTVVPAVCDINKERLESALSEVEKASGIRPEGYGRGVEDFRRMLERDDLDATVIATPWEWHAPMAVASMKAGKYASVEVPAAITMDECWDLVRTSESTGVPCMMLENTNYFSNVLMVLMMVRQGLFGELIHCEAGYQHDIRRGTFDRDGKLRWRAKHSLTRDGNLYPTHPIGPIAWWMDINRGDRFKRIVSMSSKAASLNELAEERFGPDHPNSKIDWALGDINTSLIKTEKGRTVTIYHDVNLPRPYDLIYRVQGTKGIYQATVNKVYIEGRSPEAHAWEDIAKYEKEFEHPFITEGGKEAQNYYHSGADYFTLREFLKAVRNGTPTPQDVYDAATWSAIIPLSIESVGKDSEPIDFPDFTDGKWKTNKPIDTYTLS